MKKDIMRMTIYTEFIERSRQWFTAVVLFNVACSLIISIYLLSRIGEPTIFFHILWISCAQAIITCIFGLKIIDNYEKYQKADVTIDLS